MAQRKILTEKQRSLIKEIYAEGLSCRKVAERVGLSEKIVSSRLKQWKLRRNWSQASRKYRLYEDVFSIDSTESFYWTGFLMADGNVWHSKGRQARTSLGLKRSDKGHIEKLAKLVGMPTESIHDSRKRPISTLIMASDRLASDLALRGVVPRKSLIAKIPSGRYDLLWSRDFWRGVVDGDGSIGIPRPGYSVLVFTSGSAAFLDQFDAFLRHYNLPTGIVVQGTSYTLNGAISVPVIRKLYQGAEVYLDRKYRKAMEILQLC